MTPLDMDKHNHLGIGKMNMDYSSWLIEDLEDYINELLIVRTRAELYSERAECNAQIQEIKTEINKRKENEC